MNISNFVLLVGRVGVDPLINKSNPERSVLRFSLATSSHYRNSKGERVESTEWHNCTAFGKTADLLSEYVHKGSKILIHGKLSTSKYETEGGKFAYSTNIIINEVEFLDKKPA